MHLCLISALHIGKNNLYAYTRSGDLALLFSLNSYVILVQTFDPFRLQFPPS